MTKVICSSVIRASQRGDSHGGIFVVDIDTGDYEQILDWNRPDINWDGRGGDRGIRSMRFYNNELYAIAGNAVLVFNREMKLQREFKLDCLINTHECSLQGDFLYVIANLFDSILVLDLKKQMWVNSWHFQGGMDATCLFDPFIKNDLYPSPKDILHLDSVTVYKNMMFYSGDKMTTVKALNLRNGQQFSYAKGVDKSHNAQPYKGGVIYNIARNSKTIFMNTYGDIDWEGDTPLYSKDDMIDKAESEKIAKQGYTRGMCLIDDKIIVGSSPATINVFTLEDSKPIQSIRISKDIRNSICGIARYEW